MTKITNQFAFYKTKSAYNAQASGDGFADGTIIFVKDSREIITHGTLLCSMSEIYSALTACLKTAGGTVSGDLHVQGTLSTDTDIQVGGVKIANGTADQILLGNGSVASLSAINNAISAIPKFAISVVSELPTSGISTTTIYLLSSGSETNNVYTEYIYVGGKWEKLGEQKLDLSGYALKTDVAAKMPTSATASNNSGEIELLFSNAAGQYLFSVSIEPATTTAPGLMSAADKKKLDGIAAGANAYTLPQATGTVLGGVKVHDTALTQSAGTPTSYAGRSYYVQKLSNGLLAVNVPWANTTYGNATTSAAGLMSAADKQKLDLISWYEGN